VPVCESHDQVIANCKRIAGFIKGAKLGYPGLDLIIFPEYSTQVRSACWGTDAVLPAASVWKDW
jgi:predicted amidohydrolase